MDVGIKALATNSRKSVKEGAGVRNTQLRFAKVTISPGDYLYADNDGIVLAENRL